MGSPIRLFLIAFLLISASTSLTPARAGDELPIVRVSSTLTRTSDRLGQVSVTADIASGFHIYAMSQPRPFLATMITVAQSPVVRVMGSFTPSRPPKVVKHQTLEVEPHEYRQQVTWTAPVEFSSAPGAELIVRGAVFVQASGKIGA